MKIVTTAVLFICLIGTSQATVIINHNGSSINYGSSWDSPSVQVEQVLQTLNAEFAGDVHLTLVNGFSGSDIESWLGGGVSSIILEELAGYKNNTTFGWYDAADSGNSGQIFSGANGVGASSTVDFASPFNFGFYIEPNGSSANTMYTQNELNTHNDYQVAIFKVEELVDTYILGWEDLDLNGGTDGDRDYQDMIVRLTIKSVPEPGSMLLLMTGLLLLGVRRLR